MDRSFNRIIKKHAILAVFTFVAVILLASTVTYAVFQIDKENTTNQRIAIGNLDANLSSINGAIILNDLYPKSASEVTEEDKRFEYTISNTGDYDLKYQIYLKDATVKFLNDNTGYEEYTQLKEEYYKYINVKIDGTRIVNLEAIKNDDKFILFDGTLAPTDSEDHYLQFFIDKGDTTETGAPNDISGSIISLDIYMDASAYDKSLEDPAIDTLNMLNLKAKEGSPNFAEPATTDEGVYAMADDYGTSYYYRGNVANNYVKFAGFWWRIIRINGDGSLRIIYDGTQAHTNGTNSTNRLALTSIAWNTTIYGDAKFVGYMYGGTNTNNSSTKRVELGQEGYEDSTNAIYNETDTNIKIQLESWYKINIADQGLDQYVSDEIFCNDRSTLGREATNWTSDTGLGYGTNVTGYGALSRFRTGNNSTTLSARDDPQPQFTCPNKNDAFTKEDTEKGNGALSQKVGLITADEIVAAGSGKGGTSNSSYYLYKGNWYWSLSPYSFNGTRALVFDVYTSGSLSNYDVDSAGGVAPVINLSAEYVKTLKGTGIIGDEYEAK